MKPYKLDYTNEEALLSLTIWPHRSCEKSTFFFVVFFVALILILPSFLFLSINFAITILPFSLSTLIVFYFVGMKNFNDGKLRETLKIYPKNIVLERIDPNNNIKTWYSNPFWTKVNLYTDGPIESYLTLKGNGKEVEVGSFLTPKERINLKKTIEDTLIKCIHY